jgi:anaerobic magnesium-protoporphyrin IX monomethyl ester cyclase
MSLETGILKMTDSSRSEVQIIAPQAQKPVMAELRGDLDGNKIVLITPPYERIAKGYEFVKVITNRAPTLGLLHLAAAVREAGYEPGIIESDIFDMSPDDVVEQVVKTRPAFVGITLFTVGVWVASEIARKLKHRLPNVKIFVGGPHISSMGSETMERFHEFDVAAMGEGEEILILLMEAYKNGAALNDVPGIIFRDPESISTRIIKTPRLKINKELDRLPLPAWDLLPDFPKAYRPAVYDYPRYPVASFAASRGCPFHCKFCDTSTFGAAVRAYTPQRVYEIMVHLKKTYGIRHMTFVDDLFTASKVRTTALCNLIIENKLDMTWSCASRTDVINPETLKLMAKAGCWEISFGLESGSDEMLQKMDKAASVEKSRLALQWCADVGIRTKGLFMLGYPGETMETIEETKVFLKSVPLTIMHLTKFTPYPGSPIYHDLYGTSIRDDHWEKMNGMNFLWCPEGLTQKQLDSNYGGLLRYFYTQPKVSWYYTWFTLRHPHHFFRLLKFVFIMLKCKLRAKFFSDGDGPEPLVTLD